MRAQVQQVPVAVVDLDGSALSAQVLARRKEFGLLAHLGLTRRQVIALVGAEAAAWLADRENAEGQSFHGSPEVMGPRRRACSMPSTTSAFPIVGSRAGSPSTSPRRRGS